MSRLDQLIISVAQDEGWGCPCPVVIGDDPTGELTKFAFDSASNELGGPGVYIATPLHDQAVRAATQATNLGLRDRVVIRGIDGPLELSKFLTGVDFHFVLSRLPSSMAGLDHLASATSHGESTSFTVGANNKYLSRNHNEVLSRSFADVRASLGQGKFRCLVAEGPQGRSYSPTTTSTPYGKLTGIGSCFGLDKVDRGGEFLATTITPLLQGEKVLDLGCGNGLVSLMLSTTSNLNITACDINADAVLSARHTLNGLDIDVVWDDAGSSLPDHSFDVVALNPPFHKNSGIDTSLVDHLLNRAQQLLVPGGKLYLVFNSHLRYQYQLAEWNQVTQLTRNSKFTVLCAS